MNQQSKSCMLWQTSALAHPTSPSISLVDPGLWHLDRSYETYRPYKTDALEASPFDFPAQIKAENPLARKFLKILLGISR